MQNNKSEDKNGLTKEFWKTLIYKIKGIFCTCKKESKPKGYWNISQKQTVIK